jgi:DNA-binding NarL/FixJ family response regulator
VAQLLAHGHHSKLIAYELGVSTGTVTAAASSIVRKLGLRRRVDLLLLLSMLNEARVVRASVGGAQLAIAVCEGDPVSLARLSPREREVVRRALLGETVVEVAARLRRSPRTVAHQLQSAYRKLGIASRAELLRGR